MKSIILLVSRQAMANVLPVLMYKPDKVYLLTTKEEAQCGNNLKQLFRDKKILVEEIKNIDAYDGKTVKNAINNILLKSKDEEIVLNLTGGTKLMALAAFQIANQKKINAFYCNTEKKEIIHLRPNKQSEKLKLDITVKDYLFAYGFRIVDSKIEHIGEHEFEIVRCLIERELVEDFISFTKRYRRDSSQKCGYFTILDNRNRKFSVQKTRTGYHLHILDKKYVFNTDNFLKGDWLEIYAYTILKRYNISSEIGLKIRSIGGVENEIDIVFLKDYQLHIISCKSGKLDSNKTLYEIETLRAVAGGTFGRAYLVSVEKLSSWILERAKELNIRVLTLDEFDRSFMQDI